MFEDEKKQETQASTPGDLSPNGNTSSSPDRERYVQKQPNKDAGGIMGMFSALGNLPEWGLGGKKLHGKPLNYGIGIIASCGFLMFGYDQGVLSALLTLDSFQRSIPLMTPLEQSNDVCWTDSPDNTVRDESMCTGDANTQAAAVAIYQIGCFMGAVLILYYGEVWGRKSSTFWGSLIMIIGTIFQAAANGYALFVVGRIVGGIGNGMVTSTIPTWQSECARPHQRGILITLSGALISGGIMIAYWVDYGFFFLEGEVRWRFPIAFQSFFTILVMIGLLFLPDSPRWLSMRGRVEEAREVTSRLVNKPIDDEAVTQEIREIQDALEMQSRGGGFKYRELLTNGPSQNLRRTLLAVIAQFFQQICGINLITYYATFVFENSLGFGPNLSRLLAAANGTEYFLASLVALPLIERTGRRKLMLIGAVGMMFSMAMLAGSASTGETTEQGAPLLSTAWGVTATVFLFVFNSFFALGWLGMTWLYPAEITSLRIRIQANALSTCSNWLTNFLIVMITPPAFANLEYQTYIMFAVFNAAIIPSVYFFFPEPKGRSLEELDVIFASSHADGVNPVKRAREMPKLQGAELEEATFKYFSETTGSTEHVEEARRRSSARTGQ
ncbi:hypothetical protein MBLNU230_g3656t1 [Neophaeotheca triangularis]